MPRPSHPLISRDAVVKSSLRIIDQEGLDAFSLPRLARELNVRAPSLYHHFADRAEILRAVARTIVLETRFPDPEQSKTWSEWLVALSLAFRESVLRHRNAAPILLRFMPREVLVETYDLSALFLAEVGVPAEQRVLVLDGLDKLTLGAVIFEAAKDTHAAGQIFGKVSPDTEPSLAEAVALNTRDATELFAESIRCFLRGAVPEVPLDAPTPNTAALVARARRSRHEAARAVSSGTH